MAKWRIRDPSIFPIHFTEVVLQAHETRKPALLGVYHNGFEARARLDKFREWRRNLRDHPNGPGSRAGFIEANHRIATRLTYVETIVEVWVTIQPKPILSLERLNPGLFQ